MHPFGHSHLSSVDLLSASYLTGSVPDTVDSNVNMTDTEESLAGMRDLHKCQLCYSAVCQLLYLKYAYIFIQDQKRLILGKWFVVILQIRGKTNQTRTLNLKNGCLV